MHDVIIIGSGPAGLTAAIYATRANLRTLVIAGAKWGGQLMLTTLVENFPGFPEGIQGPELMTAMRKQAERLGARFLDEDFSQTAFSKSPFAISVAGKAYEGRSVIIATGADTKWLGVPGEKEKVGKGVSTCAPCDAPFFRNKKVIVVGGGDSAMEEALVLTKFASEVILIHRKDAFRASAVMQEKVFNSSKIKVIFNSEIAEILGERKVEKVQIRSKIKDQRSKIEIKTQNQEKEILPEEMGGQALAVQDQTIAWEMPADGVFVAIGHIPNSKVFQGIDADEKGFIKVYDHTKTNIEGVFVAGDVHDSLYKQAITAAGFGCMAALEVERFLSLQH
ncbi:FAD-dependent oxidoreductase [Patescibacteria group bacterium]|nr:FAD-dependent oxidoreductase [Patescibacteria group bacterium]MCL5010032.1 FAD-dependent oxidoreductase [Patescibacteria group bacterium]